TSQSLPAPSFFAFTASYPPAIYTLSLHDALPIFRHRLRPTPICRPFNRWNFQGLGQSESGMTSISSGTATPAVGGDVMRACDARSEEHTSELQSLAYLVCRLLLEKKKFILHTQV